MSLAIALSPTELLSGSRFSPLDGGPAQPTAELLRPLAADSLRKARVQFESWLRGCLSQVSAGASAAGGLRFPYAKIESSLEENQFSGTTSNEFRRLNNELSGRLRMLDDMVAQMRVHEHPTAGFWDQVVQASLEILSLFTALESERAALMAAVDPLTGLGGRRVLEECMQQERARMQREGHHCAIALLDIDHFKEINDTHGHLSGDRVLTRFAALLRSNLRSYDGVYRYGGEEFVLCLPGVHASQAKRMVDRIREAAGRTAMLAASGGPLRISFSAGIAELEVTAPPAQTLGRADDALYRAKADGRNRVYVAASGAPARPGLV